MHLPGERVRRDVGAVRPVGQIQGGAVLGKIASATTLAAPDLNVITLTELAEHARRITRASDLSLIVDADHGYGNALNTMRTVEDVSGEFPIKRHSESETDHGNAAASHGNGV